jgi:hypothetical protein
MREGDMPQSKEPRLRGCPGWSYIYSTFLSGNRHIASKIYRQRSKTFDLPEKNTLVN